MRRKADEMKRSQLSPLGLCVVVALAAHAACGGSGRSNGSDAGAGRDGSAASSGGRSGSGGGTASGGLSGGSSGGAPASGGSMASGGGSASGGATVGTSSGGGGAAGGSGVGGSVAVGTSQCSDGKDNDGDGRVDLADPDCVSPLDNDESSLSTGIPGDNMDACKQDCFFDGNSGMGDDGCDWNLKCDSANTNPGQCMYDSKFNNCPTQQSQKCINNCRKLTPNGCDCFGCCTVPGVSYPIRLTSTCTSAAFGDPAKCPACTQNTSCNNECGRCELCLGKTSIPADCTSGSGGAGGGGGAGGTTATPDGGTPTPDCQDYNPCGPTGTDPSACTSGELCITGCCIPL